MRIRSHNYKCRRIVRRILRAERIMRDIERIYEEPYLYTAFNAAHKRWIGLNKLCFLYNLKF